MWRVGRRITEAEIRDRLMSLPAVFTGRFYAFLDDLEKVRETGIFTFKALEYRPGRSHWLVGLPQMTRRTG